MFIWFCSSDTVSWFSTILKKFSEHRKPTHFSSFNFEKSTFEVVVYDLQENCSPPGLDIQWKICSYWKSVQSHCLQLPQPTAAKPNQQLHKLLKDSNTRFQNIMFTRVEKVWRSKSVKTNLCEWSFFPPHLQYVAEADICKLWQFWQEYKTLTHCNSNT